MPARIGEYRQVPGKIGLHWLERAEKALVKTTVSSGVVIERADKMKNWDADGNEYLCFTAGVAVANLGYGIDQECIWEAMNALKKDKIPPLYIGTDWTNSIVVRAGELMQEITPINGSSRVFFTPTGTLATEAAIKAIVKWRMRQKGILPYKPEPEDLTFLYFKGSFHGRSHAALRVMDKRKKVRVNGYHIPYREMVLPFPSGAAQFNRLKGLLRVFNNGVRARWFAGVFIELVQGEGGINVADKRAVKFLEEWCRSNNIPLIVDEIQTGFCRTGKFWAYQNYYIKPDIVLFGKAAGGGVLWMAGMVVREDLSFQELGEHSETFGPDPLNCAVLQKTVMEMKAKKLDLQARVLGSYLLESLREKLGRSRLIKEIRGLGLMVGIEFWDPKVRDRVWRKAEEYGLLTLPAGFSVIRLTPSLTLTKEDIKTAVEILEKAIKE